MKRAATGPLRAALAMAAGLACAASTSGVQLGQARSAPVAAASGAAPGATSAAVAAALDRPAIRARQPARAVLLGAAQCGNTVMAVGERGLIVLSTDLGRTWHQAAQVPSSTTLTAVRCQGPGSALAVGHGAVVLATADGGEHWQRQTDGRALAQQALAEARARQPEDAQASAAAQRWLAEGPDKPLLDLAALGRQAWAVGAYNQFLASADGGKTWRSVAHRLPNPRQLHLHAIAAQDEVVVIAGEQGLILRSQDGGNHFVRLPSPYQGSWFALALLDAQTLLAAGLRGQAWLTRDAGTSWLPLKGLPPISLVGARATGPDTVLLQNQIGQLYTVQISNASVRALPALQAPGSGGAANGLLALVDGSVLALTMQGALRLPAPAPASAPTTPPIPLKVHQ